MVKLIARYLKGFALICAILAPLMMLLEVFMDLQQPTLMAKIVDIGVANRDLNYVLHTGLQMILFAILGLVGGASCSIFSAIAGVTMSGELRKGLYAKIQTFSFSEIDHFQTASLITRLTNDVMQVQHMMLMMLRIMVRSPLIIFGSIVMAILLSPSLSLLFAIALPIITLSIVLVLRKSVPIYTQVQEWLDRVNTVMRENLLGIRVVKSFTMEKPQNRRFSAANNELTGQSIQAQKITFLLMPIATLVMNGSVVAILWFGGGLVNTGDLEIGKIIAFINYLVQITHSLVNSVNLVISISRAQASALRISEVLAMEPVIQDPAVPADATGIDIEFRDVSFRYGQSGAPVLKHLSFSIRQGDTVGIIGATGSGKSSLVSLIPRLYDPVAGQVLLGQVDIRQLSLADLRRRIGVVMQENILFSGTVASNLRFGHDQASDEELRAACEDAQASGFINALPKVYASLVEQRGRNFSGGQKQRLSIARTLLKNPDILILDDATSAVDLITEARMRTAIEARMQGRTVIIIAQRISAVMAADKILVLDHGEISAIGNHRELLDGSEIYRSIAVTQLGEEVITHVNG